MTINFEQLEAQMKEAASTSPPLMRAAYSDRTAWLMACLLELAYQRFEGTGQPLLDLATELAELADAKKIAEVLKSAVSVLESPSASSSEKLASVLACAEFSLVDEPINIASTDTQCYVAIHKPDGKITRGMAVLVFRGTTDVHDWITNLEAEQIDVARTFDGRRHVLGRLHKGFHDAYMSAEQEVDARLQKIPEDMPLYITGHSLGGALAAVATWYQRSDRLAACYTFGGPRVGTPALRRHFRTPIYRIINVMDPVPAVPPGGAVMGIVLSVLQFASTLLPKFMMVDWVLEKVSDMQNYRHYGDSRYLTDAAPGTDGLYPGLDILSDIGPLSRFISYAKALLKGGTTQGTMIVHYHDIWRYRDKLRAYALTNKPLPPHDRTT